MMYRAKIKKYVLKLRYQVLSFLTRVDITLDPPNNASHINKEYVDYQHTYTSYVKRIIDCLKITSDDSLFDFGSGKGGVMIFFSRYSFGKIGGVELMPELDRVAQQNFRRKKLSHLKTFIGNAAKYNAIDEYNYFYFNNPFTGDTLRSVVDNIRQSFIRQPRKITVIYQNPRGRELFERAGIFSGNYRFFIPSSINRDPHYTFYGRQFIDVYCTEKIDGGFGKYLIR